MKLQVYDPPMCCSSGVCGANVDETLVRFSSDLKWLESQSVEIERFNLIQNPVEFKNNDAIKKLLASEGKKCLPIIVVNGSIVSKGIYPSREELASYFSIGFSAKNINSKVENITIDSPCCGEGCC